MMEAIRIRREGYALREELESFYKRFSILLSSADIAGTKPGIEQLVRILSKRLNVTDADWQIGHSKIFLRRELSDKLERLTRVRVHAAACTLSRFARHSVYSRLSRLLVTWVRFRLKMKALYRETKAASLMVAWARRCWQQRKYNRFRQALVKLQAEHRRKEAVEYARKVRDPYFDLSYRDCKTLLKSEQERLEDAVKAKKFRQAADLEVKM
jgi:myosin heavy subunit